MQLQCRRTIPAIHCNGSLENAVGSAIGRWPESVSLKQYSVRQPVSRICPVGHFMDVGVFPTGIDVNSRSENKHNPEVQLLRRCYAGMRLIVGRDKLDDSQGIRHKSRAFEYFLKANPVFQGRSSSLK
ncbi:hypothetical protein EDD15DRAFT_973755 [Pisolithus albus]|nr:hypothetical protein EDD15DRAFT_973755 [Pisolithus albus]